MMCTNPPYPQLKGADRGRFWKVLKVIFGIIIGLLFLVAAVNAVTFEWAIISVAMFCMMFTFVMQNVCE